MLSSSIVDALWSTHATNGPRGVAYEVTRGWLRIVARRQDYRHSSRRDGRRGLQCRAPSIPHCAYSEGFRLPRRRVVAAPVHANLVLDSNYSLSLFLFPSICLSLSPSLSIVENLACCWFAGCLRGSCRQPDLRFRLPRSGTSNGPAGSVTVSPKPFPHKRSTGGGGEEGDDTVRKKLGNFTSSV